MMLEDEFCDIIKKARNGQGLSLDQVAVASGLGVPVLRELEAGRRAPARAEALAVAAALTLDGPKLAAIACDHWHPAHPAPTTAKDVILVRGDIGGYEVKGYLFSDPITREAVMIDSGYNPDAMLRAIERERFTLIAICLTHGHADHAGGIDAILTRHHVPVYIGEDDWDLLGWKPSTALRKFACDGDALRVGGVDLRFVTTPGHTPGGVCYRANEYCFVGDTLFAGSIGRANPSTLYPTHLESVRNRVLTLPDQVILFPGHGPATTVREEKDHNPFG
jgi:hydroxyacylglutathione hydrolase